MMHGVDPEDLALDPFRDLGGLGQDGVDLVDVQLGGEGLHPAHVYLTPSDPLVEVPEDIGEAPEVADAVGVAPSLGGRREAPPERAP